MTYDSMFGFVMACLLILYTEHDTIADAGWTFQKVNNWECMPRFIVMNV